MSSDSLHGFANREQHTQAFRAIWRLIYVMMVLIYVVPFVALVAVDVTGAFRTVAPVLLVVPLYRLRYQAIVWIHYIRAFGFPPLRDLGLMLAIDRLRGYDPMKEDASSTDRADARTNGPGFMALAAGIAIIGLYAGLLSVVFIAVAVFEIGFKSVIRRSRPPAVLLLTSSGVSAEQLLMRVLGAIWPNLVASSLRHETLSPLHRQLTSFFSYRTADEESWKYVVTSLMRVAPIIAIDTRSDTENIRFEIDHARGHVDPGRLILIVQDGVRSSDEGIAGARCLSEGELIEYLNRRLHKRRTARDPAVDVRPNVYTDEVNGYFTWEAPPGWRAHRQRDERTKVSFTHPTLPEVGVSFIVRSALGESYETLHEVVRDDGEAAEGAARLGFRTRASPIIWLGLPAFQVYARGRNGMRWVQWRCITPNELSFNVQYTALSLNLFRESWGQVQHAVSTIQVNAELHPDLTDDRRQQIDAFIRRARVFAETFGKARAEQELREGLDLYPGDPRLLRELEDLRRL